MKVVGGMPTAPREKRPKGRIPKGEERPGSIKKKGGKKTGPVV